VWFVYFAVPFYTVLILVMPLDLKICTVLALSGSLPASGQSTRSGFYPAMERISSRVSSFSRQTSGVPADLSSLIPGGLPFQGVYSVTGVAEARVDGMAFEKKVRPEPVFIFS